MIIVSERELLALGDDFSKAWYMLTSDRLYDVMPPIYYVERGEPFLQVVDSGDGNLMKGIKFDNSIYLDHLNDRIELKAKKSGYLVRNSEQKVQIFEPFVLNGKSNQ